MCVNIISVYTVIIACMQSKATSMVGLPLVEWVSRYTYFIVSLLAVYASCIVKPIHVGICHSCIVMPVFQFSRDESTCSWEYKNAVSVTESDSQLQKDKRVREKIEMLVKEIDDHRQEMTRITQEKDKILMVLSSMK